MSRRCVLCGAALAIAGMTLFQGCGDGTGDAAALVGTWSASELEWTDSGGERHSEKIGPGWQETLTINPGGTFTYVSEADGVRTEGGGLWVLAGEWIVLMERKDSKIEYLIEEDMLVLAGTANSCEFRLYWVKLGGSLDSSDGEA